jgi:asparagine synthase (glutamine-hydrolysing)
VTRPRYLIVVPPCPATAERWAGRLETIRRSCDDSRWAIRADKLLAIVIGGSFRSVGDAVLIGTPIERTSLGEIGPDAGFGRLVDQLIANCWGGYIAAGLTSEGIPTIFRAPLGDLPCFWSAHENAFLIASDVALLQAAGLPRPRVDPAALSRLLIADNLRTSATCLDGVTELPGGTRLAFAKGGVGQATLWSPWDFASEEAEIGPPAEGLSAVRDAVRATVAALASRERHIVLKLSGGLDSSIVAACLVRAGASFTALNLVTQDAPGDERHYARQVSAHLHIPLVERLRETSGVSLEQSEAARLPRPSARSFAQETSRICAEIAFETGSTALFDGGGGDNVFCSLQSARPAADCLLRAVRGAPFWSTAASIGRIAQVSAFAVAAQALRIAMRRSRAYRWDVDLSFLSEQAREVSSAGVVHPWLSPPEGILPGKVGHVALIAAAQSVVEGYDVEDRPPTFSPLMTQPVVEACLRIPTWLWFEDGRNRAVARRAFADDLPGEIIGRRSKGGPDCFIAQLFEANRPIIREMLLGGELMRFGLLDGHAIEAALQSEAPVRGHEFLRLMRLTDADAWARARA